MGKTIVHPPRTVMEVFRTLPEGTLAEVIDCVLYVSPTPIGKHQRALGKLFTAMNIHVSKSKLGEVFLSPFDVFLDETANAVQPDLFYIAKENLKIVDDNGHVHGVPDLIVEILSPGNKKHDMITKRNLYEKFGVKEYWIADPETKQAFGYFLEGKTFQDLGEFSGKIESKLLMESFSF